MESYREFILGMKRKFGTARGHVHYKQMIQIYLTAKRIAVSAAPGEEKVK
jgi:hypothetical protein